MGHDILRDALILLSTIDPIGTVLVFASVSGALEQRERQRLARRAILIAGSTLVGFLVLGQVALAAMHVSLASFQLAGGVFLFLFGAQMTLTDFTRHASLQAEGGHDPAVFPLAIPAIASPGALLAVVVLTDNARHTIGSQAVTALVLLAVLFLTYLGSAPGRRVDSGHGAQRGRRTDSDPRHDPRRARRGDGHRGLNSARGTAPHKHVTPAWLTGAA